MHGATIRFIACSVFSWNNGVFCCISYCELYDLKSKALTNNRVLLLPSVMLSVCTYELLGHCIQVAQMQVALCPRNIVKYGLSAVVVPSFDVYLSYVP